MPNTVYISPINNNYINKNYETFIQYNKNVIKIYLEFYQQLLDLYELNLKPTELIKNLNKLSSQASDSVVGSVLGR